MARRKGQRRSSNFGLLATYPPYNSQFIIPMHLKYECSTASTTSTIYVQNLCNAFGISDGNQHLLTLLSAIRLKRVEFRGISSAVNKITTFTVTWEGPLDSLREITCSGNTESPLHLVTSPSLASTTSMWKRQSTNYAEKLFTLKTDADYGEGQVDIFMDVVLWDDGASHFAGDSTTAAPSVGAFYTTALDNYTGSNWNTTVRWIPVGRTTVV